MDGENNQDFEASRKKLEEMIARQAEQQQKHGEQVGQVVSRQQRLEDSFIQLVEMVSNIDHRVDGVEALRASDQERSLRLEEVTALLVQMVRNHDDRLDSHEDRLDTLRETMEEMIETHRRTDERLDAFINVLERYISEGRNGNGGSPKP